MRAVESPLNSMEMKAKVGFSCHWNQWVNLRWEQLLLWNNIATIYLCRWQRSKRHLWWEEWLARLLTQCRWWNYCSDYWGRTHESLGPNLRETQRFISHLFVSIRYKVIVQKLKYIQYLLYIQGTFARVVFICKVRIEVNIPRR